jgi:steroid delta-isomerase-like uncharacterized protein
MEPNGEGAARDLMQRWFAAWNDHDPERIAALMTDDVVYEDPGATEPVMRGKADVNAWVRTAFAAIPDVHINLHEAWVSPGGAVIATYFCFTATQTGRVDPPGIAPTNARIDADGMDRSEIRDGLIARHQIFWDIQERARKVGLAPARGSVMERAGVRLQHLTAWRMRRTR